MYNKNISVSKVLGLLFTMYSCFVVNTALYAGTVKPAVVNTKIEGSTVSVESTINALRSVITSTISYRCLNETTEKLGNKTLHRIIALYYYPPGVLEINVITGENSGTHVVFKDHKLTIDNKNILGPFKVKLDSGNPITKSLRGKGIAQVGWVYHLSNVEKYLIEKKVFYASYDVFEGSTSIKLLIKVDDKTHYVLYLQPSTYYIIGYRLIENGEVVEEGKYRDIQVNIKR
ncbi:MAG: hypothetical protein WC955_11940 [Elusimicrobiota bacterium]